jgi:hypothetical protein
MKELKDYSSQELEAYQQQLANQLEQLSRNATQNGPKMKKVMGEMTAVNGLIDEAKGREQEVRVNVNRPHVESLEARREEITLEIQRLAAQPTKYYSRIKELDQEGKALDTQIERAQTDPTYKAPQPPQSGPLPVPTFEED